MAATSLTSAAGKILANLAKPFLPSSTPVPAAPVSAKPDPNLEKMPTVVTGHAVTDAQKASLLARKAANPVVPPVRDPNLEKMPTVVPSPAQRTVSPSNLEKMPTVVPGAKAPAPVSKKTPAIVKPNPVLTGKVQIDKASPNDNAIRPEGASFTAASAAASTPAFTAPTYTDAAGKVDAAALKSDMQKYLSAKEMSDFQKQVAAAGKDPAKQRAALDSIKSSLVAKQKSSFDASQATSPATVAGLASFVTNANDPEKLSQSAQAFYSKSADDYKAIQDKALSDIKTINENEKAAVAKMLGLNADGTPDMGNKDGLYAKYSDLYDKLVTDQKDKYANIASNINAETDAAGRQQLIAAGLSGRTDPGALAFKMGAAGMDALSKINTAQNELLTAQGKLLQDKQTQLSDLLSKGQISRETYDKASAAAEATANQNVYDNNVKLMEAIFGKQDVANAYDAKNRTDRINTIESTLTAAGVPQTTALSLLDVFNTRRDETGALLTPERALIMMGEWAKPEASISPAYKPTTPQEKAAYKSYQEALKTGRALQIQSAIRDLQAKVAVANRGATAIEGVTKGGEGPYSTAALAAKGAASKATKAPAQTVLKMNAVLSQFGFPTQNAATVGDVSDFVNNLSAFGAGTSDTISFGGSNKDVKSMAKTTDQLAALRAAANQTAQSILNDPYLASALSASNQGTTVIESQ